VFTGLVEDVGTIERIAPAQGGGARLTVRTRLPREDLAHGSSIAVDGACLTVVDSSDSAFSADVTLETLRRTTFSDRKPGDAVNLERPLAVGERLGGHLVLGHVDGIARVRQREAAGEAVQMSVELPGELLPLVVEKGSIALDGVSLTVNGLLGGDAIALMIIPETLRATTLGHKRSGDRMNVEADMLAKHVARLLEAQRSRT
jgi:riboflavin synthase